MRQLSKTKTLSEKANHLRGQGPNGQLEFHFWHQWKPLFEYEHRQDASNSPYYFNLSLGRHDHGRMARSQHHRDEDLLLFIY